MWGYLELDDPASLAIQGLFSIVCERERERVRERVLERECVRERECVCGRESVCKRDSETESV